MSVRPYRVRNDDPRSWAYYPVIEARCLAFIQKHGIDFDLAPFGAELRARFNDPALDRHRLYVFLDPQGGIVGHMLGWIDVAYNHPYVHVHQLELDAPHSLGEVVDEMFAEIDVWAESLNRNAGPAQNRVDRVSFWTWRDPEVFARYLRRGSDAKVERYVIEYSLRERAARTAATSEELH